MSINQTIDRPGIAGHGAGQDFKHRAGITARYGRMFPGLPTPSADEEALIKLGRSGAVMDDVSGDEEASSRDNHCIAAGFTFLGQFVAHDITADRSPIRHHEDIGELENFRTPRLDLESVYARGPLDAPYLYDVRDTAKFLLGTNNAGLENDLPRNSQGIALSGDPRNDVHSIISQLHLAFLKAHNRLVDSVRGGGTSGDGVFAEAQRLLRWHYQWIVVHEFLPLTVGQGVVDDILQNGPRFYQYEERPYLPVEFSDAAYRYGHSQIRAAYQLNDHVSGRVFPECLGGCWVPQERVIDWRYFFAMDEQHPPQPTRQMDARLVHPLIELPQSVTGETEIPEHHSLAVRDLLRGYSLELPSGEAVAREMSVEQLTEEERGLRQLDWEGETPIWYYVLKEAEVRKNGEMLGEVGARIVAEVLLSLIAADVLSYRSQEPDWTPTLPSKTPGQFLMADLLRFASV